ncbi:hypothetical protein BDQ12DRAFT_642222 [Crucibulum laeve]|uniref:SET domain-containing protein n=1 Tax=Crucibulum laeve TaxID=68775 RepID=A0A5C3MK45_9AGAR|nr:hypothetical protein BDQ12DRAFT_642222 [Crucibulum laeve]
MEGPLKTWTYGAHTYVLNILSLPSTSSATPTTIATLLHPSMTPLLPPSPTSIPVLDSPCFEIKQTMYKGAGMFAARGICAGQVIIDEHPVIILPNKPLPLDSPAYDELEELVPEDKIVEMLTLTNCQDRKVCPSNVEGIARTNALRLAMRLPGDSKEWEPKERQYGGIFLKINRCNHSCGPNAAFRWNVDTLSAVLYAVRPISEGEEITITYADPTRSRAERIAHLEQNYGFTCDCPYCSRPQSSSIEEHINASDASRAQLGTWFALHPVFSKWMLDPCLPDDFVISSHLHALKLIEQEGMQGMEGPFLEDIAMCYAALGDKIEFMKWANRVIARCGIEDVEMVRKMKVLLQCVESIEEDDRRDRWSKARKAGKQGKSWGVRSRQKQRKSSKNQHSWHY